MRRALIILLLILLPCSVSAENMVTVTGMRISPAAAKTVMTFDLSAKTKGTIKFNCFQPWRRGYCTGLY